MAAQFSLGDAVLNITGDTKGLTRSLAFSESAVKSSAARMQSFTQSVARVLQTSLVAGVAGVTAATVGMVKAASDFESAFTGVRKTVDASPEEFDALRDGILKMTRELPKSGVELAKIMEIAGQMGISGKDNLLKFTKTIAMLGDTTNLTVDEAAASLGQFINITNGLPSDIDQIASAIVALGNKGTSTEKDITEMALRIAGAGTAAKMSQADILGWSAATANMGIEAEMGGTAISKMIMMIASAAEQGTDAVQGYATIAGMTAENFQAMVRNDPSKALEAVFRGLNNMNASGKSLFPVLEEMGIKEVRLRDTVLRLALGFDKTADSLNDAKQAYIDNNALTEEARKRYETFSSKLVEVKNAFVELAIAVGSPIMDGLATFIKDQLQPALIQLIEWVTKNKDAMKTWIDEAIQEAVKTFESMKGWIVENKDALIDFGKTMLDFVGYLKSAVNLFTDLKNLGAIFNPDKWSLENAGSALKAYGNLQVNSVNQMTGGWLLGGMKKDLPSAPSSMAGPSSAQRAAAPQSAGRGGVVLNGGVHVTTSADDNPRAFAERLKAALGHLDMQAGV